MTDAERRALERAAANGDASAALKLGAARNRGTGAATVRDVDAFVFKTTCAVMLEKCRVCAGVGLVSRNGVRSGCHPCGATGEGRRYGVTEQPLESVRRIASALLGVTDRRHRQTAETFRTTIRGPGPLTVMLVRLRGGSIAIGIVDTGAARNETSNSLGVFFGTGSRASWCADAWPELGRRGSASLVHAALATWALRPSPDRLLVPAAIAREWADTVLPKPAAGDRSPEGVHRAIQRSTFLAATASPAPRGTPLYYTSAGEVSPVPSGMPIGRVIAWDDRGATVEILGQPLADELRVGFPGPQPSSARFGVAGGNLFTAGEINPERERAELDRMLERLRSFTDGAIRDIVLGRPPRQSD